VWALHGLIYRWPATRISEEDARARLASVAFWLRRKASAISATVLSAQSLFRLARIQPSIKRPRI
jgi:hypothetical protein